MKSIKFDVFGQEVLVAKTEDGWQAFYVGNEGKRRLARDIIIPGNVEESNLLQYLDDLCHEWATDRNNSIKRVD
ncbi:MAG: DUF7661 family protein [Planctomycetota bacterium]|jgi:hypothetical protein